MSCECAGHSKGAQYSYMTTTRTSKDSEERAMDSMLVTSAPASGTFSHVFGQQCQLMEAAVQSLHTLNDQISHFVVTKSKTLEEDKDPFLPTEKESLKNSMTLMRHLLMDAQIWPEGAVDPDVFSKDVLYLKQSCCSILQ
ncbi:putative uncharacterized protein C1orf196 [Trichosurus vulpecula]|uniref:putative uncharacterized protein C1orf196 n=1 Tax=Trichosurus vulpecula TaxID=9337 RepID=UPI00186B2486|nr:putative uncharacterized protein C1orf196 [Trichosurus vulpecula]